MSATRATRGREAVIVAGARTAFLETAGAFADLMPHELGAAAIRGVMQRVDLPPEQLGMVAMGIVVHEIETTNVAREAMLSAGLSSRTPAFTTAMAGLSPNVALASLSDMITLGRFDFAVAGGMETFSDVPIRLSPGIRRLAMRLRQARTTRERLAALRRLRPADLGLHLPAGADFTTGQTMGQSTEAMVRQYPVTREESDAFTLRSHQRAVASARSWHAEDIVSVAGVAAVEDNTPRAGISMERLAGLAPVFDRKNGIITAGNSSRFTDGAAAVVLAGRAAAEKCGIEPQAIVRDYQFSGVPSLEQHMLLGPAMSIPLLLARNGLGIDDVGVFELHEAFAAQLLVNQRCLASRDFAKRELGRDAPLGAIPDDRLNVHGGSLALGNPFAATGARLVWTATRRLRAEKQRYAVVSSCAGGGLGAAILLENPDRD